MTHRPPQRRGLGRGLGSLIPSGPVPSDQGGAESDQRDEVAPAAARVAVDAPTAPPADWIGRIPHPSSAPDGRSPVAEDTGSEHDSDQPGASPGSPGGALTTSEQSPGRRSPDDELQPVAGAQFAELPVASITPNPRQPRQVFDEEAMAELVHSIREVGLLQPVVVRPIGEGRYELIMGERRLRASREAGFAVIPAIIRDTGDDDLLRDALLENLHRAQLNPLEEAAAYRQLLDDFGCTHDELAGRIGRSRPQISNTLRLLNLSPAVQRRVAAGVLSAGHARTLLGVEDPETQDRLAGRVVAEGISVRGLEELVAVGELGGPRPGGTTRGAKAAPPELSDLGARLSDRFDTRVKIDMGRSKGRVTIEFASVEDLHRIVALMEQDTSTE